MKEKSVFRKSIILCLVFGMNLFAQPERNLSLGEPAVF
jgi:hypothetical protein